MNLHLTDEVNFLYLTPQNISVHSFHERKPLNIFNLSTCIVIPKALFSSQACIAFSWHLNMHQPPMNLKYLSCLQLSAFPSQGGRSFDSSNLEE